jgi:tellurite resistance protein
MKDDVERADEREADLREAVETSDTTGLVGQQEQIVAAEIARGLGLDPEAEDK